MCGPSFLDNASLIFLDGSSIDANEYLSVAARPEASVFLELDGLLSTRVRRSCGDEREFVHEKELVS